MAAPPQHRRRRRPRAAAALAALCCLGLVAAAQAAPEQAHDYVVVFKRGFDASKVKALCSQQAGGSGAGGARFAGLCRRRFSKCLNGFAGGHGWSIC